MNADEFRAVLREVIRDELGAGEVELGGRWMGGEVVLKPGKEGTQDSAGEWLERWKEEQELTARAESWRLSHMMWLIAASD